MFLSGNTILLTGCSAPMGAKVQISPKEKKISSISQPLNNKLLPRQLLATLTLLLCIK